MCRDCENDHEIQPSRLRQNTAAHLAQRLRGQGFGVTQRFAAQFARRVFAGGKTFDPRAFRRAFYRARHFRLGQTGTSLPVALVYGLLIAYRRRPGRVALLGILPATVRPRLIPSLPLRPLSQPESEQHGSRYRAARQVFLRNLATNPNVPRFMQGWSKQEQRRQRVAAQQRAAGFRPTGQERTVARQATLQAIAADPRQSASARQWAAGQLRRLARGQGRLRALQAGHTPRRTNLRGVPGYDVGHPIGYVRGTRVPLKSLQDPRTFRPEMATQNRARPGIARRLNLPRAYHESDPWA